MKAYVYETINLLDGTKYIGCHKCDHFDENYKGSGKYLQEAIDKYGWDNFSCSIIKEFEDADEAYQYEYDIIKELDAVHSSSYYNAMHGGGGRWEHNGVPCRKGAIFTKEHRNKLSEAHKNVPLEFSRRKSMSKAQKGRKFGGFSKETLEHLSYKRSRFRLIHKGLIEFKVDVDKIPKYVNSGWEVGASNTVWVHKNSDSFRVYKHEIDTMLDRGYLLGRATNSHRYWITNDEITRRVLGDTLKFYINNGFRRVDGLDELLD